MNESNHHTPGALDISLVRYHPEAALGVHQHERSSIGIILGGRVQEIVDGNGDWHRTGALVIKPAGLPHRNRFGPQGAVLLSIRSVPPFGLKADHWNWRCQPGILRGALRIASELATGDTFGAGQEGGWILLGELAGSQPKIHGIPRWLADVRERAADLSTGRSVGTLARDAGVHPIYLTRIFRRHFGVSISGFTRRLKIARAADLLRQSDMRIADVSAHFGFADQSHFCRIFKAETGLAPSAYRSLLA